MSKTEILALLPQIISYLFGAGGLFSYLKGRKERKVALKNQNANALQAMQKAYDDYVKDHREVVKELKQEIADLKYELKQVKKEFKEYRIEHKNCA